MQAQVRLLQTTDIDHFWDTVRPMLNQISPVNAELTDEALTHILERLVSGTAQCWVAGMNDVVYGAVFTTLETDTLIGHRYLHVGAFLGFETLDMHVLNELHDKLSGYAKMQGCVAMIARIPDPRVQNIVLRYGAEPIPMFYEEVS